MFILVPVLTTSSFLYHISLGDNYISDLSPLAGLTNLQKLDLMFNSISDISPLVENSGLSEGDTVDLSGNPLSTTSVDVYIPQLEARGVTVVY
jgi:Leucine-rich repeat (LRR) protein